MFPDATFADDVMAVAHRLSAGPTRAYGIAKSLVHAADGVEGLDVHLDTELAQLARIADGDDFAEGLSAFFAKREPRFEGVTPRP